MLRSSFLLFIALIFSLPSFARQSCDWPFRTQINVQEHSTSGSQLINYQVKFEIDGADLSSDYNWSNDGQDLYIYDSDDSTKLEFWLESWNSATQKATIWVLFPTLDTDQVRSIYFYYGNESAPAVGGVPFTFTYPGIKYHTRFSTRDPNNLTQARAAFDASNDRNSDYGCGFITDFELITNSSQFGNGIRDFATFSESYFLVAPGEEGRWEFRYGADFGRGGALYVNGNALANKWREDLWWGRNWERKEDTLVGGINLTEGYHKFEVLGFEKCCDGGLTAQFKKPGGDWTTFSTASIDIRSRACPLERDPTYTIGGHDVCRVDLGFDNTLSYPAAWVAKSTRPVTFAIENLSSRLPSLPDTRIAITLGAGLSLNSAQGNNWNCTTVNSNLSSTELSCLYGLAIDPNGARSSPVTLNIASTAANSNANFLATVFSKQIENQLDNNQISTNLPVWQLTDSINPTCTSPKSGVFTRIYNSQGYRDNYANSKEEFNSWENDLAIRSKLDGQTVLSQINNNSGNPFQLRNNEYYLTLIEGYLYAPEDGRYRFAVDGDDAVELKINNTVYSSWYNGHGAQGSAHDERSWWLAKGYHKLNYRMQEYTGGDSFYAYWRKPSETNTDIIPASAFFHCAGEADIRLNMTVNMQDNPDTLSSNDKAIPGAVLRYNLHVTNEGNISTSSTVMELVQTLSTDAKLYVDNLSDDGPIDFKDGNANNISGLSYRFNRLNSSSDDLSFSNNGGTSYTYIPTADSEGFDSNVTHIKMMFTGSLKPKYDQGTPEFTIEYQVKVK